MVGSVVRFGRQRRCSTAGMATMGGTTAHNRVWQGAGVEAEWRAWYGVEGRSGRC